MKPGNLDIRAVSHVLDALGTSNQRQSDSTGRTRSKLEVA